MKQSKRSPLIFRLLLYGAVGFFVAPFVGFVIFLLIATITPNYAAKGWDTANKIILSQGAKKICIDGDNGRGFDNRHPWATFDYQFDMGREQTLAIVKQAALQQGFTLVPAQPKHGHPNDYVGNESVEEYWNNHLHNFFTATQISAAPDFKKENLMLTVELVTDKTSNLDLSEIRCGTKTPPPYVADATHTSVEVHLTFPDVH